jgi:uncharacterized protein YdbL (DUF1318 family)
VTIAAIESNRFEAMEQVADLTMQGHTATAIAKELNLQRKVVLELQEDYRIALSKDGEARDLARDHLNLMVKHYDSLIKKFYDLIEEINSLSFNHQVAGQKNMALKAIADLDAKRIDALQKAGLLESSELGAELADAEEKREILIHIIREAVCDDCREKISYKIAQVTGKVEVIDAEVISG